MKRIYLSAGIFLLTASSVLAQDIHFTQFNENPLHLNPAYTGLFDGLFRVTLNYRSQWASMGHPYTTAAAAFDMPVIPAKNRGYIGIGAYVYRDQAGDSKYGTFQGLVSVSGIVPLNDYNKLSVGLQGGYSQRSATISGLQWENQYVNGAYDPTVTPNEGNLLTSYPYADFSGGLAYQYRNTAGNLVGKDVFELNVGGSAFHLNRPVEKFHEGSEVKTDMRLVLHTQVRIDIPDTRWSVRPSAYVMKQGAASEFLIGGVMRYRVKNGTKVTNFYSESGIGLGVHYRWKDAIMPQLYYDLGDLFVGLSYDFNVSSYAAATKHNGGFEITLRYANLNGALYKNRK